MAKAPYKGATGYGQPVVAVGACGHDRLHHGTHRGDRLQGSVRKGLLSRGEAAGAAPARDKATGVVPTHG
ncbi:hypothetical protein B296_00003054 [Ensete ventricosum]|uniref:Uncharacterized protein n=1 Tax=Ensete ventricosum TaxID=4639 RepID=A0A426ZLR4_ENSVE|nr:hypothetical protein B296_00003054 [Ensete ventricosum]